MASTIDPARLLRLALRGNAAFSTLSALTFFFAAAPIAGFLGAFKSSDILILGVQLVLFATWLFSLSSQPAPARWQVWLIIALDVLWVAGSFGLLASPPPEMTTGGKWAIGMVADVVGVFAILQFIGLRRMTASIRANAA